MAQEIINVGTTANDGTGDKVRDAFIKVNSNFTELYDDGGDNITVTDPTTSLDGTLNDALQNILDSTPATPTLASVLVEGNITDGTDISISDGDKIVLDNGANLKKGTTDAGLGGNGGIALRCAVDYELKWEAGILYVMGGDGFTIRETKYNFANTPTVNDDDTKGFVVGSRWILDNDDLYSCTDDTTGAAVWELIESGVPTLQQVLDNNHDLVDGNFFAGNNAGVDNTGENVNAFGNEAGSINTGNNVNALGYASLLGNEGNYVNAFGPGAGQDNTFNNINLFGNQASADDDNQTVFAKWVPFIGNYLGRLSFNNITEDRKWELPDADGTIALTTDVGVTSVGLTMPSAFSVTNSPITSSGDIAVTGAGLVSQYVRGDGTLANFPASTGGGASLSFYLNGSVSQGTIGGVAFREMDRTPILGAGTDFTINANGYIQSFITDANVPNLLEIPAGNWSFETYFSASSGGGSPSFYIELYKWNGTTLSLIASNSASPRLITDGTSIESYFSVLAVPQTTLLVTDRLAVRIYVNNSGRTITLHTEDNNLCQIITTFTTGLTALNGLTDQVQNLAVGTSGTDFAISSTSATHTFNLPTASASNRGALSSTDWSTFNNKQNALGFTPVQSNAAITGATKTKITYDAKGLVTSGADATKSDVGLGNVDNTSDANKPVSTAQQTAIDAKVADSITDGVTTIAPSQNAVFDALALKQNTLVSATNIKTINGASVLGSGDLVVGGSSSLTVGTTPITSGTIGRVFFEGTGNVLQQSASLFWDNTNARLGVGATPATTVRLDVRAQGALSTDKAFRVRNSADTSDMLTVSGNGITEVLGTSNTATPIFIVTNAGTGNFTFTIDNTSVSGNANFGLSLNGVNKATIGYNRAGDYLGLYHAGASVNYFLLQLNADASFQHNKTSDGTADFKIFNNGGTIIGASTLNASAQLQVDSTTKGFLPPRMTTTQKNAIASPAAGLVVYDTTLGKLCVRTASAWETITSV